MVALAKADNEFARAFGRRLRELREGAGLTPTEASRGANMKYPAYARLERGERVPGLDTLIRLADSLGVSLDRFRVEDGDAKPAKLPVNPAAANLQQPDPPRPAGKRK